VLLSLAAELASESIYLSSPNLGDVPSCPPEIGGALRTLYVQSIPSLESFWHEEFGYGFDKLTNSEATYLKTVRGHTADSIRDRVLASREHQGAKDNSGVDSQGQGGRPVLKYSKDGKIQGFYLDGKAYLVEDGIACSDP
jgi:hypothetical protein